MTSIILFVTGWLNGILAYHWESAPTWARIGMGLAAVGATVEAAITSAISRGRD